MEAPDVSSPIFPAAAEVDDLLAMFDNVYEDAFFKTWDDVEVKITPVLLLKSKQCNWQTCPLVTNSIFRSYLMRKTRQPSRSSTSGYTSTSGTYN